MSNQIEIKNKKQKQNKQGFRDNQYEAFFSILKD